MDIIKHNIK